MGSINVSVFHKLVPIIASLEPIPESTGHQTVTSHSLAMDTGDPQRYASVPDALVESRTRCWGKSTT